MPKGTKSSASSATRKKKAQKAAKRGGPDGQSNDTPASQQQPTQRGQKKVKGKNKEPKNKVYIPPQKPKQDVIDPLDSLGLASLLPSDLVVLLRKAAKKDVVTRSRALEGMIEWIQGEAELEDDKDSSLVLSIPCWSHLFPRLSISPNRRLRQLTSQINTLLLARATFFEELQAQPEHLEAIIGGMLILAFDPDRQVARISKENWERHTDWTSTEGKLNLNDSLELLLSHISTIIFHESDESAPPVSKAALNISRDAKNRDDVNIEEDTEGTDARLVYGALGALGWLISTQAYPTSTSIYEPLFTSPTLWTSLSRQSSSDHRSLGSLSPIVRNAAWQLVRTLVVGWKDLLDKSLPAFGFTALQSAFEDNDVGVTAHMRDGLVLLVKARPDLWKSKEDQSEEDDDESDDDDEDDDDSEEVDEPTSHSHQQTSHANGSENFPIYQHFSDWLSSALRGGYANYRIVNILLSTIPAEVFPPSSTAAISILSAMYQPIDERSIEGREALRAFVPAYLECFSWSCARIKHLSNMQEAIVVAKDIEIFYTDFVGSVEADAKSGQLERVASLGEDRLIAEVALFLRSLGNIDIEVAKPLLDQIRSTLSQTILESSAALMDRNVSILRAVIEDTSKVALKPQLHDAVFEIVNDLTLTSANVVASGESLRNGTRLLTRLMQAIPNAQDQQSLSSLALVYNLLRTGETEISSKEKAEFFATYVVCIKDETSRWQAWNDLLDSIYSHGQMDWVTLGCLITAMQGREASVAGAAASQLDNAMREHYPENAGITRLLMGQPRPYIQQETVTFIVDRIIESGNKESMPLLDAWLQADSSRSSQLVTQSHLKTVVPKVAHLALIRKETAALPVWKQIEKEPGAAELAVEMLKEQLLALTEPLSTVLRAAEPLTQGKTKATLLPDQATYSRLLTEAYAVQQPASLAILDPLASPIVDVAAAPAYDEAGLTSYCRCSIALLNLLEETGDKAAWSLPHLVGLGLASDDVTAVSGAGAGHFSNASYSDPLSDRVVRVATSILSSTATDLNEAWYADLVKMLRSSTGASQDDVQSMILQVWNTPNSSRLLSRLLKGILNFSGAGEKEAVHLLRLAQSCQDAKPLLASAIYISVKDLVLDSPVYDRIRNELAARLTGVPPSKASTEGVKLLRLLIDVSPPSESTVPLIPQQRCIFLLQALQKWIASDESESFPSEIHSLLVQALYSLLPIVQNIAGSHLPFICDIMDVNLSDGMEDLVCIYHTLLLVEQFHGLTQSNIVLREVWDESKMDIFEDVHDLFLSSAESSKANDRARQAVDEALADIVRISPESTFSAERDIGALVAIIKSGKKQSQILAYRLLSNSIRESVKELVVEVALGGQGEGDGDATERVPIKQVKIAPEILAILQERPTDEKTDYTLLLAWLAVFEYFEEGSLQLKSIYTSQLQSLGVVEGSLLPLFFAQTELNFDPSRWALDELYLDGELDYREAR
jgi:hypothetical protein